MVVHLLLRITCFEFKRLENKVSASDRASYRNRGGIIQRIISFYKAKRYLTKCGSDVVIKSSTCFRIVENSVLEVGAGSTIQDQAFSN